MLYDPPKWGTCDIDACRGVVWRVSESDAVIQVEANPPDAHQRPASVLSKLRRRPWRQPGPAIENLQ